MNKKEGEIKRRVMVHRVLHQAHKGLYTVGHGCVQHYAQEHGQGTQRIQTGYAVVI